MRSFITGANGLIGSHIVEELLKRGENVIGLAQHGSDVSTLEPYLKDVDIVYGDVRDRDKVRFAIEGCDEVYHLAGKHCLWERDRDEFNEVNVVGTENVVEEAVRRGLRRIVFTSTCDIVGTRQRAEGDLGDERDVITDVKYASGPYGRSKILSERAVRNFSDEIETVVVHPSCPIGKNNTMPTEPGRLIESVLLEKLGGYIKRDMNFVNVGDCARGHVLAMKLGKNNERYVLSGENVYLGDFIGRVAELGNVRAPKLTVPYGVGIGFSYLSEFLAKVNGHIPRASVEAIRLVKNDFVFSCEKAKREIGYRFGKLNLGIEEAVEWHLRRIKES